jgi:hypothetical protein
MPELSKDTATAEINRKLETTKAALAYLDKLTAKLTKLEAERADLQAGESKLLKDERDDETKLPELLALRARLDLKQAAIDALRTHPAKGNNIAPEKGQIDQQGERVAAVGTILAQLFKAWNDASLVAHKAHITETIKDIVQQEDLPLVLSACSQHPLYRQLESFYPPHFHSGDISQARSLPDIWEQLLVNAESYGKLEVSVHDAWIA